MRQSLIWITYLHWCIHLPWLIKRCCAFTFRCPQIKNQIQTVTMTFQKKKKKRKLLVNKFLVVRQNSLRWTIFFFSMMKFVCDLLKYFSLEFRVFVYTIFLHYLHKITKQNFVVYTHIYCLALSILWNSMIAFRFPEWKCKHLNRNKYLLIM